MVVNTSPSRTPAATCLFVIIITVVIIADVAVGQEDECPVGALSVVAVDVVVGVIVIA